VAVMFFALTSFALNCGTICAGEDGARDPVLLAKFGEGKRSPHSLFLYSKQDLQGVQVWLGGKWATTKMAKEPHAGNAYYVYRVSSRFAPRNGRDLLVNSWDPERETTFRHELRVEQTKEEYRVNAQLVSVRTRDEYLAAKSRQDERTKAARKEKLASDPYGFTPLLNEYRVSRGLRPVVHDPGLSRDARVNNGMAAPHGFMGRARVQNWGSGFSTARGVLRGWQQSPGHNQSLLDPTISRAGIAYSNGEWTFNGG